MVPNGFRCPNGVRRSRTLYIAAPTPSPGEKFPALLEYLLSPIAKTTPPPGTRLSIHALFAARGYFSVPRRIRGLLSMTARPTDLEYSETGKLDGEQVIRLVGRAKTVVDRQSGTCS